MNQAPTKVIDVSAIANFSPKQEEVFRYIGKKSRIFAGGARGGGKSHLAVAIAVLSALQFPGLRVMIIRRSMEELRQQLIDNLLLKLYRPDELFQWRRSIKTADFPNGSKIYFRSIENPDDVNKVLGVEFGMVILDEGNQLGEIIIQRVAGSIRSFDIPNWKPTLLVTGNPGGLSDRYFKDRYIRPDYSKWEPGELAIKDEHIYVPFGVRDNPYATSEYIDTLASMPEAIRRAWLDGDWDSYQGQFFEDWNPKVHIVEPFNIPQNWSRWRAVDLGYGTHPSVCLFAAQDPHDGTVYIYDEVATKDTTDIFIDMILNASGDDYFGLDLFDPNSLKSRRGETTDSVSPGTMFREAGIWVIPADNARVNGWMNVKAWLADRPNRPARLRIFSNCLGLIETIPLQRYVEGKADLNTRGQDDYVDALRYLLSHIPYGSVVTYDGQIIEPDAPTSYVDERRADSQLRYNKKYDALEDKIDYDGLSVSRFAIY